MRVRLVLLLAAALVAGAVAAANNPIFSGGRGSGDAVQTVTVDVVIAEPGTVISVR